MVSPAHPVVLYDGVCSLCNASVQAIIARDPVARFRFASLQSDVGAALAAGAGIDATALDTLVLVTASGAYVRSDAVLGIAERLGWPWRLVAAGRIVPRPVRDAVYQFVAHHRHRFAGRLDACPIPTPDLRARFLDLPS